MPVKTGERGSHNGNKEATNTLQNLRFRSFYWQESKDSDADGSTSKGANIHCNRYGTGNCTFIRSYFICIYFVIYLMTGAH